MRLKLFNPDKELKKTNRKYTKKQLIITLLVLVVMITIGSSYAIFSIQPEYHTFVKSQVGEFSTGDIKLSVLVDGEKQSDFPAKGTGYAFEKVECENGSTGTWNSDAWQLTLTAQGPDKCTVSFVKGSPLTDLLLAQYQEGASTGLVKDTTNTNLYYFKGTNEQVANNFLWYGGHQWRVLEFDNSAKTITLITQQPLTSIQPASAVWTSTSTYDSSYINQWLNTYFYNSLDSSVQANIQDSTFNIGIYNNVSEFTTTKKVGLLDQTQYQRAGRPDSFLNINNGWWLGNRSSSSSVRYVNDYNGLDGGVPSHSYGVRAVVKISDLTITGGDGTLANNYRTSTKAANTSDIQVGEYINVPYNGEDGACGSDKLCTMRVVSKNVNSIKVVLNGLLPTTSAWADSASDNITTSDTIYTNVLNPFIANIDNKYITTGTFGVGMYEAGNSYTVPAATTISANVGLPTVGEMFSGNDIDLSTSSTKTFVDVATIENSTASSYYWTMNRGSSSSVRCVDNDGYLRNLGPSGSYGVRAVLYLKSGTSALTFTGGEGTPQNPYTLN